MSGVVFGFSVVLMQLECLLFNDWCLVRCKVTGKGGCETAVEPNPTSTRSWSFRQLHECTSTVSAPAPTDHAPTQAAPRLSCTEASLSEASAGSLRRIRRSDSPLLLPGALLAPTSETATGNPLETQPAGTGHRVLDVHRRRGDGGCNSTAADRLRGKPAIAGPSSSARSLGRPCGAPRRPGRI